MAEKKIICITCGNGKQVDFYTSRNPKHRYFERIPICKSCIKEFYDMLYAELEDHKSSMIELCKYLDISFVDKAYEAGLKQFNNGSANEVWSGYLRYFNSQFRDDVKYLSFNDSDSFEDESESKQKQERIVGDDKRNKEAVIKRIGYEPYAYESVENQRYLYNVLNDMIDEAAQQDGYRLQAILSIATNLCQINNINKTLAQLSTKGLLSKTDSASYKSLVGAKKDLMAAVNKTAQDNCISMHFSNSMSKGAGTLSGILKDMQEKNIMESSVNIYDVETCSSMQQVADMSTNAIFKQLQLDENDYTEIIGEQRARISELASEIKDLKEKYRLASIQLADIDLDVVIIENESESIVDEGNMNENH